MFEGKRITSIHYVGGLVAGQPLQIDIHYTGGAVLFTDPDDVSKIAAWIRKSLKLHVDTCSYLQYTKLWTWSTRFHSLMNAV